MENLWEHHFKFYDLFQNNRDAYNSMKNFHLGQLKNCKNILDTGCGSGNLTLELLKRDHSVTAVDFNEFALEILKKKCVGYNNLKIMQMDVQELNFEKESFDGVSSMIVVPFVKNNKKYFFKVYNVLKKSGRFSISVWAPVPDSWHGIIDLQKEELTKKGILPKFEEEWNYQMKSSKEAIKMIIKGSNLTKIKNQLRAVGFKKIKIHLSSYGKYAYFLTCEKI